MARDTPRRRAGRWPAALAEGIAVDLLFASTGIEADICAAAEHVAMEGFVIPVATVGHLLAMKTGGVQWRCCPRRRKAARSSVYAPRATSNQRRGLSTSARTARPRHRKRTTVRCAQSSSQARALSRYLRRKPAPVSSALSRTEVLRALLPSGDQAVARGRAVLQRIDLARERSILNAAGVLHPAEPRSLDAIHLATAHELGDELSALVTYDDRMVTAAKQLGYRTVQPR